MEKPKPPLPSTDFYLEVYEEHLDKYLACRNELEDNDIFFCGETKQFYVENISTKFDEAKAWLEELISSHIPFFHIKFYNFATIIAHDSMTQEQRNKFVISLEETPEEALLDIDSIRGREALNIGSYDYSSSDDAPETGSEPDNNEQMVVYELKCKDPEVVSEIMISRESDEDEPEQKELGYLITALTSPKENSEVTETSLFNGLKNALKIHMATYKTLSSPGQERFR